MGTVNVVLGEDTRLNLILGQQLENAVTEVVFDFSAWQTTYGAGTLALSVQRPGDEMPYAVTLTTSGTNATWSVTNLDTAYKGVGHIQLTYTVGSAIKKSVVYKFTVYESLGANGEYPSPGQTWQEEMEEDIADVKADLDLVNDGYYSFDLIADKYILRDNGQEANYNGWSATDFIPLPPNCLVVHNIPAGTNLVWGALYDENKNYIAPKSWNNNSETSYYNNSGKMIYTRTSGTNVEMHALKFKIYPIVDKTLELSGCPADAKTVGDELTDIDERLSDIENADDIQIELQSRDLTSIVSNEPVYFVDKASCDYQSGESYRYSTIGTVELQTGIDYILYCGKMNIPTETGKIQLYVTYTDSSVNHVEVVNDGKYKQFKLNDSKTIQSCTLYAISVNGEAVTADGTATFANIYIFEGENLEFRSIFDLPTPENNDDIPSYYASHLADKEAIIREHEKDCSFNGDSLVFITDTHHSADYAINDNKESNHANANHSVSLIKDVIKNTATRLICFGGDLVNTSDGIDEMIHSINCYGEKYKEDKFRLRYCVGNHEYYTDIGQAVQNRPSAEWLYGGFTKYNEDVILGKTEMATYYFDNVVQKIRYFVISCGRDTETTIAQMAWVMNEFTKVPANYHIVCIGHAFMVDMMNGFRGYYRNVMEALDAVKAQTTYTFNNVTYDYSSLDNVDVVCVITGHTHIDGYLTSSGGITCICTTCDSYRQNYEIQDGSLVNVPRAKDTINEQAFDVIQFDFTNKKIYCTRIGYGSDREFSY